MSSDLCRKASPGGPFRGRRALGAENSKSWALKPISDRDFGGYGVTPITEQPSSRGYDTPGQKFEVVESGMYGWHSGLRAAA